MSSRRIVRGEGEREIGERERETDRQTDRQIDTETERKKKQIVQLFELLFTSHGTLVLFGDKT